MAFREASPRISRTLNGTTTKAKTARGPAKGVVLQNRSNNLEQSSSFIIDDGDDEVVVNEQVSGKSNQVAQIKKMTAQRVGGSGGGPDHEISSKCLSALMESRKRVSSL
jgi:hypothetical protein